MSHTRTFITRFELLEKNIRVCVTLFTLVLLGLTSGLTTTFMLYSFCSCIFPFWLLPFVAVYATFLCHKGSDLNWEVIRNRMNWDFI